MIEYKENVLTYDIYTDLRQSVGWINFSPDQTRLALTHSLLDITVWDNTRPIAMGRIIGDGLYDTIVDVIVHPQYQGQGIGRTIMEKLLLYGDINTPDGGRTSIQLIAEKGKEAFYQKLGFKLIPHEYCGSGMRKIIYKEMRSQS